MKIIYLIVGLFLGSMGLTLIEHDLVGPAEVAADILGIISIVNMWGCFTTALELTKPESRKEV